MAESDDGTRADDWPGSRPLLADDTVAGRLGIELVEIDDEHLVLAMLVRADMANVHGFLHGGLLMFLVDTVQGVLANDRQPMVTASASIEFLRPAVVGTVLTAVARRRHDGRTSSVFAVEVTDGDGRLVAVAQSRCLRLGGPERPDPTPRGPSPS